MSFFYYIVDSSCINCMMIKRMSLRFSQNIETEEDGCRISLLEVFNKLS